MEFNQQAYQAAKKDVSSALRILDAHFLKNTYLVGNQVTLADICVCCALVEMYKQVFAPRYIEMFSNVNRWFNTCIHQPEFANVLGKIVFATKETQAPKPKKEKKNKGKNKGGKQKQQQPKKEKKKKPVHWEKLLPKSSMSLDTTKKLYFNKRPFNANFFQEFWPTFDAKGYSFWIQKYNYNA